MFAVRYVDDDHALRRAALLADIAHMGPDELPAIRDQHDLILDLDRPVDGAILVDQSAMQALVASLAVVP